MIPPVAHPPAWRLLLVAGLGTAVATGAVALAWGPLAALAPAVTGDHGRAALDAAPPAQLLASCAAVVLLGCTLWLWTAGLVSLARLAAGHGASRAPGVPRAVHRAVLAACGIAAAGLVVAAPAGAVPTPLHEEPRVVPLRAEATAGPAAATAWPVRSGDTLWAVAEARLTRAGTPPSDAEVVRHVRALHRLNRAAVPDPDLIHPGQLLRLPPA